MAGSDGSWVDRRRTKKRKRKEFDEEDRGSRSVYYTDLSACTMLCHFLYCIMALEVGFEVDFGLGIPTFVSIIAQLSQYPKLHVHIQSKRAHIQVIVPPGLRRGCSFDADELSVAC